MPSDIIRHFTSCPLDCPDLCALQVDVADGRIVKIDGRAGDPVTDGFICGKVKHFGEHVHGPERILTPARRVGPKGSGQFESISWDEAYERAAGILREARERWGGESILPFCYGGSNGKFSHDAFDARLFRRLGASQLARTVCAAPTGRVSAALYGKMHGVGYEDYAEARLIVIWGCNPQTSGVHLMPFIATARERGAKLVVVDPRSTPLARQADLHLPVQPGTDVAVALSVIHWFFDTGRADLEFLHAHATGVEELRRRASDWSFERAGSLAGVSAADLARFAELYAAVSPAVIRCGWGIERTRSAGSNVAAVLALPAVAGKFGVRGGGYTLSNSGAWKFAADAAINEPPAVTRTINMNQLGRALSDETQPPVKALFVYNANPLATIPHQQLVRRGLEREDLQTIVFEQVLNDTAMYADLLLPATTFLEHHDYRAGYGYSELRHLRPVIAPVGQAKSNDEVFVELVARLGLAKPDDPIEREQWLRTFLGQGAQAEQTRAELAERQTAGLPFGRRPVQFVDVFPGTSDGKIQFCPAALDAEAPQGLYQYVGVEPTHEYPLRMISPACERLVNSTLGQLWKKLVPLELHPDDAASRGIVDGQTVRAFNERGEVRCPAKITRETRPGVVVLPKGLWRHHTLNGQTSNALAPDDLTDVAGGACFNDSMIQVEAAS